MADLDKAYIEFLSGLKQRIATSRYEAARLVNTELLLLYWDIGNVILEKQADRGWGKENYPAIGQRPL